MVQIILLNKYELKKYGENAEALTETPKYILRKKDLVYLFFLNACFISFLIA